MPTSGSDESWVLDSASPHLPAQGEDSRGEEGGEREQPSEAIRGERVASPALPVALPGHSSPCAVPQAAVQRADHLEALLEQQRRQLLAAK